MSYLDTAFSYTRIIRVFGLGSGISIILRKLKALVLHRHKINKLTKVDLPGFGNSISLRISSSDWAVFRDIFVNREYLEPSQPQAIALKDLYRDILGNNRCPLILDCGANIGLSSLWYANLFPDATIMAIEPEPANFLLLESNTVCFKNIKPIKAAISSGRSGFRLANVSDAPWAWTIVEDEAGDIKSITVADVMSMVPNCVPFIAKIDIEGHEVELFSGAPDSLTEFPLIVCEHHDWLYAWKGTAHAIFYALSQAGVRDYLQNGENTFCYSHRHLAPPYRVTPEPLTAPQ